MVMIGPAAISGGVGGGGGGDVGGGTTLSPAANSKLFSLFTLLC